MPNQPMQINRKEFQELLKEIQQYNKLDLVAQAIQTKYAKEMTGEDHEERLKAQQDNNDILKKIYEAILTNGKQTEKVADNVNKLAKETKNYKPVSDIKDDEPATMKEDLKSLVAGTKRFGSGIKSAVTGAISSTAGALKDPLGTLKAGAVGAGKLNEGLFKQAGDILATPEDYTVEGGRFAEAYSKTAEGTRFQKGGKGSLDVGLEKFNELKAKEEEIKGVEQKINEQKKYGFEPNKGDVEQLETLKSQYAEADIRQKPVSAKEKIEAQAKTENPNIIDEPNEVIAEETKKQSVTFKELLDTTKESLDQLKAIRASLEGTPASQSGAPAAKPAAASAAPAQQETGGGLLGDLAESGVGKKAMGAAKGFGAKAFGALKAGGAMLGKGALAAGKVIGGAALAKPALIAAGVGLAAYGAYKGYQALTGGAGGDSDSTKTQVKVKESLDLGKFADKDPKGHQEFINFRIKKASEIFKELQRKNNKNKDPDIRQDNQDTAEAQAHEEAVEKFKDKLVSAGAYQSSVSSKKQDPKDSKPREMSLDELKAQRQKVVDQGPRTKNQQSIDTHREKLRTMDMAIAAKEQGSNEITGYSDPPGEESTGSSYGDDVQASAAPKEKTMGQKIAGFFGFGGKEETEKQQPTRREMTLDELKAQRQKVVDQGPRTKNQQSIDTHREKLRTMDMAIAAKEQGSNEITGYSDPPGEEVDIEGSQPDSVDDQIAAKKSELSVQAKRSTPKSLEKVKTLNKELADLEAKKMTQSQVPAASTENAAMKEEMAAGKTQSTPVVMNNVSNNNTTTYVPVKGEPRPNSRGSALDRYNDRVAAY